jgi:NADH:ubiquinone oxidoreductase subunit 2 (subunit N)
MINELYLNFCEIFLSIIIFLKILLIVIEKYYSIINRILIQNNFIIFFISFFSIIVLLPIIGPLNLVNSSLINLINFINIAKLNKSILLIKLILILCYFLLNFLILKKLKNSEKEIKFDQILILDFLILNSFFLISTTNFFELLLCLEINNIIFLILATTKNFQLNAIEAAFKYFFLGALTTTLYLLGVFFIYYSTGLIYFDEIKLFLLQEFFFFLMIT